MEMGRIHPGQAMVDDVGDGAGRAPDRRQHADEDEDLQDIADGPHAPPPQSDDLAEAEALPESLPRKTQQAKSQGPQQRHTRADAQGQSPQEQRYDDDVHGHDSIPRPAGPVKCFSTGKIFRPCRLRPPRCQARPPGRTPGCRHSA